MPAQGSSCSRSWGDLRISLCLRHPSKRASGREPLEREEPVMSKARSKGRPRIDDREAVLAYFTNQIDSGTSVTDAARNGLTILDCLGGDDSVRSARRLGPATLERRFREAQAEVLGSVRRVSSLPEGTRFVGISPPRVATGLLPNRELKRGRPRLRRTR